MTVCTSTMKYNLQNILTVIILIVGSEQLLGRQHLNVLSLPSNSLNICPLCLYTVMLAGLLETIQWRGSLILLVLQLTGCPLELIHSPPDKMELDYTHWKCDI